MVTEVRVEDASVEKLEKDTDAEDSNEPAYLNEASKDCRRVDLGIDG